jgi:CGNR zinc finger
MASKGREIGRSDAGEQPRLRVHEDVATPPAPGEVELVRSFLSLHEHADAGPASVPPGRDALRWWLAHHRLVEPRTVVSDSDADAGLAIIEALRATLGPDADSVGDARAATVLNDAARAAGLGPVFGPGGEPALEPTAGGVRGVFGRILAIVFVARIDGRWAHLKECRSEDCRSVFFDRSRNHSGRWCSMESCGNRNKVRAWRERRDERDDDA